MIDLRYYQQEAVNAVYAHLQQKPDSNPCAVLPTGAGKSIVIARIVTDAATLWGGRVLILAHVKELLEQNAAKIQALCPDLKIGMYSAGLNRRDTENQVLVAGIQSVYNKADELGKFDLILVDECFVGDTLIDTPHGKKRIDELLPGDTVETATGYGIIEAVSCRKTENIISLELNNGNIILCTPNHPFFTENGWTKAGELEIGAHLYSKKDLCILRNGIPAMDQASAGRENADLHEGKALEPADVLLNLMRKAPEQSRSGKVEPETGNFEAAGGERMPERTANRDHGTAFTRVDAGIYPDHNGATTAGRSAEPLQNRHCQSSDQNSAGNRRVIPSERGTKEPGHPQNAAPGTIRVARISNLRDCGETLVYNLQVRGSHTYFAGGVLVHNCHLIPPDGDGMYQTLLQEEKKLNGNVRLIGFTATPYRLRGGLICKKGNLLNEICYEIGVRELIMRGYLSKLRSKNGKTKAELENLHIRGGEFIADEVAAKMDNERLVTAAVSELIQQTADRKKVLIFASSVLHAKHIKTRIEEASGQECGIVVGNTSREDRAEILARFQDKPVKSDLFNDKPNLKFLVNVGVLTTGFDAPAVDTVVLLRPTASPGLYYQMVGRGFRLSPDTGKTDCMILDYGQNIMRHGPVDMIRVDESNPDGRKKKPIMRECPQCQAVFPAGRTTCPDCGYEMPREEGKLHHGASAASDGILSGESSETEFEVKRVYYSKHFKRNAPEKPPTLKVEYAIGFNDYISDWICPEHTGYARKKSEKWWKERAGFELPDTVDECLIYADAQKLKEPVRVKVRKLPGSQWPTITAYEFDPEQPEPNGEPTITESQAMVLASQRIAEIRKEAEAAGPWTDLPGAETAPEPDEEDDLEDAVDMPF